MEERGGDDAAGDAAALQRQGTVLRVITAQAQVVNPLQELSGSITLAFWMCSLDVLGFTVENVFHVIFIVNNSKMTLKTHSTVKRTSKTQV
jgi:hypothetical protein